MGNMGSLWHRGRSHSFDPCRRHGHDACGSGVYFNPDTRSGGMRWFGYFKRAAAFAAGLAVGLFLIGLAAYLIGNN